jgi:nitroreductase
MNKFTASVPVLVAVVQENMNLEAKVGALVKNKDYSMMDLGLAIDHFCLQAAELGLSTCIMGAFDEAKMKELLHVPEDRRIFIMLAVGYPSGTARTKVRKELNAIHSFNSYEA